MIRVKALSSEFLTDTANQRCWSAYAHIRRRRSEIRTSPVRLTPQAKICHPDRSSRLFSARDFGALAA